MKGNLVLICPVGKDEITPVICRCRRRRFFPECKECIEKYNIEDKEVFHRSLKSAQKIYGLNLRRGLSERS